MKRSTEQRVYRKADSSTKDERQETKIGTSVQDAEAMLPVLGCGANYPYKEK
jgi:hypothetical protein